MAVERAVLCFWLAHPVSRERGTGSSRTLRTIDHHRDASFPGSVEPQRTGQAADACRVQGLPRHAAHRHGLVAGDVRPLLFDDRVRARLGHDRTWLHARKVSAHAALRNPVLCADDSDLRHPRGARAPTNTDLRHDRHCAVWVVHGADVRLRHTWGDGGDGAGTVADGTDVWTDRNGAVGDVPDYRTLHGQLADLQLRGNLRCVA